MKGEGKGLTDEDLLGLVDVTVIGQPVISRSLPDTLVFTVEYAGKRYRIGVIGKGAYEAVKKRGYKDAEGRVHLVVPRGALRETGAG